LLPQEEECGRRGTVAMRRAHAEAQAHSGDLAASDHPHRMMLAYEPWEIVAKYAVGERRSA
jgi:hypothetical protein